MAENQIGLAGIIQFIERQNWRPTNDQNGHEFIDKRDLDKTDREIFTQIVADILYRGYRKKHAKKSYVYINIKNYKYWVVNQALPITSILNRQRIY